MENGDSGQQAEPAEGYVSILNVSKGDFKLTFNKEIPGETQRAASTVQDMLKRGYIIVLKLPSGKYKRVKKFDDKNFEYIVKTVPQEPDIVVSVKSTQAVAVPRSAPGCAQEAW